MIKKYSKSLLHYILRNFRLFLEKLCKCIVDFRSQQPPRSFCLVCGKVPKQPNASPFYDVETATLPTGNSEKSFDSLSKKLREVIKIPDSHRNKLVPSKEVCKKCFRQLVDIDFMENQVSSIMSLSNAVSKKIKRNSINITLS